MKEIIRKVLEKNNYQEVLFLLFLFVITLFFHIGSYSFRTEVQRFPMIISLVTGILIIIYLFRSTLPVFIQKLMETHQEKDKDKDKPKSKSEDIKESLTFISFILLNAFVFLSYYFGFFISSVFIAIAFPFLLGKRKIFDIIPIVVIVVILVFIFQYSLGVPLTRGVYFDLRNIIPIL